MTAPARPAAAPLRFHRLPDYEPGATGKRVGRPTTAAPPARRTSPLPAGTSPGDPPQREMRMVLQGILEALGGYRPVEQLRGRLSERSISQLRRAVQQRPPELARRPHRIHISRPCPGVQEVCATVPAGRRLRSVALRMEACHGRWCCTELALVQ